MHRSDVCKFSGTEMINQLTLVAYKEQRCIRSYSHVEIERQGEVKVRCTGHLESRFFSPELPNRGACRVEFPDRESLNPL